jgi:hypothetical protein
LNRNAASNLTRRTVLSMILTYITKDDVFLLNKVTCCPAKELI